MAKNLNSSEITVNNVQLSIYLYTYKIHYKKSIDIHIKYVIKNLFAHQKNHIFFVHISAVSKRQINTGHFKRCFKRKMERKDQMSHVLNHTRVFSLE